MANWKIIGSVIAGVLVLGAIGNAIDGNDPAGTPSAATSSSPNAAADGRQSAVADDKPKTEKATVPNFVGMGLQSAQDTAQDAGFHSLKSHDSLGRGRLQAFDRHWKVCSQNIKAGTSTSTDTELDFGAVKLEEDCPAKDQTEPSAASGRMPDFTGTSVNTARAALDSSTSLTVEDASGEGRFILIESNWKVCTQTPTKGTKLNGQPVKLTAVKFEESCL
ncbi:PASTA domain-containing protein [Streptomyces sp. NBC_00487]|uniref:PASTA domain-containing protein n=1 Tax=unclassified Streptomyces TaxID=2593676 RepID=UPI002E186B04|nr:MULTISPECIES: PASTA domain-containing protein [unclassified Streptomyces]